MNATNENGSADLVELAARLDRERKERVGRIRKACQAGAVVLALLFGGRAHAQSNPCTPSRQDSRMRFRVESVASGHVVLRPQAGDSVRVVAADSLARTVRVGNLVRRCNRPVTGGRVVTWCIDHKASGLQR